ncbi:MAG TPA: CvpA family protein [Rhizomicrobium sp.]|jgi:membrane protein required for colicin V production|nr:CvpA family protein [Rhizomicrobium sp.]
MNLSITTVDFLTGLVVLVSTVYAVWRGFLWETLSVFAWIAAAFACLYFGPAVIPLTRSMISASWLASLVGYVLVFLAVLIPLSFISHRFSQTVKSSPIGPFDRALGAAFGVVRGLVIVGLVYIAFTYFVPVPRQPHWLAKAQMLPVIQGTDEVLLSLVPERDHPDFAVSPGSKDEVGDLIRRNDEAGAVRHRHARAKNRYGARDRQALDRLIEATGKDK